MYISLRRKQSIMIAAGVTALASFVLVPTSSATETASSAPAAKAVPAVVGHQLAHGFATPLTTASVKSRFRKPVTPLQYREAYKLNSLYKTGITGKGRTIVIVDSFGSPTIQNDLDVYSKQFGMKSTRVDVVK